MRLSPGVFLVSILSMDEESQDGGEEEEDDVHDAKGEASFQHGASLVDVGRPWASRPAAIESKRPKSDIESAVGGGEI